MKILDYSRYRYNSEWHAYLDQCRAFVSERDSFNVATIIVTLIFNIH